VLTSLPSHEWTLQAAAHLLNRAAFGGSPEEIQKLHAMGHAAAVRSLLHAGEDEDLYPAPELVPMKFQRPGNDSMTPEELAERRKNMNMQARERTQETRAWWIQRMASTPYPAREKCVLFWHGHWATSIQKVNDPFLVLQQNQTLRAHSQTDVEGSRHDSLLGLELKQGRASE
jgi:uncharacterized protein (DUF1800 family)